MKKNKTDAVMRRYGDMEKKQKTEDGRRKTKEKSSNRIRFFVRIIFISALLNLACTPRSFEKPKAAATPVAAEDKQAVFENELEKMRTADLQFVFAFRRKDGVVFDGDDKKYLRANLPFNNRVVLADEGKAVIVGSNFKFPPENTDALRMRFNVEDYSAAQQQDK